MWYEGAALKNVVTNQSTTQTFLQGATRALPILLCYLPVSFAIGVLANQTGFTLLETVLMGAFVYSGSGQSIALQLFALGHPIFAIYSTTFIVNLRYLLMSAALAPQITPWNRWFRYLFAVGITDETFALHSAQFRETRPTQKFAIGLNVTAWLSWTMGGAIGHCAGTLMSDVRPYGFDFAVPSMFIALVVIQLVDRLMIALAILGGLIGVGLTFTPLTDWAIIIAGVVCASLGTWVELWKRK